MTSWITINLMVMIIVTWAGSSSSQEDSDPDSGIVLFQVTQESTQEDLAPDSGIVLFQVTQEPRKVVVWRLPPVELSLQDQRLHAVVKGRKKVKRVFFYMAVNQKVSFRKSQYKFRLPCSKWSMSKGKVCEGTGGPQLTPGDTVFYSVRVKLNRRRVMKIRNRKWKPVFPTTSSTTSTQNPTTTISAFPTNSTLTIQYPTTTTPDCNDTCTIGNITTPAGFLWPITMSFGSGYVIEVPK